MAGGLLHAAAPAPSIRPQEQAQALLDWVRGSGRDEPYLLIRSTVYERLVPPLDGLVTPLYRETGLVRNGLILLHVNGPDLRVAGERSSGRCPAPGDASGLP